MYNVLSGVHDIISRLAAHPSNAHPKAQGALMNAAAAVLSARNFHQGADMGQSLQGGYGPQPTRDQSAPGNPPAGISPYDAAPVLNGSSLQGSGRMPFRLASSPSYYSGRR